MTLDAPPVVPAAFGVPPQVRRADPPRRTRSAAVDRLSTDLAAGRPDALDEFWGAVERSGTPLVEAAHQPGQVTITFLWRGRPDEVLDVLLVGNKLADATAYDEARFDHLAGTDVWWLSLELGAAWRGSYMLAVLGTGAPTVSPDDAALIEIRRARSLMRAPRADCAALGRWFDALHFARPDPLARQQRDAAWSIASGPSAPPQPYAEPLRAVVHPLTETRFASAALANQRAVWWYAPPVTAAGLALVILLDGDGWATGGVAATFDQMITAGVVPPFAAVLVASLGFVGRVEELACNPAFVEFLADELVPRARQRFPAATGPVVVAGQSLGGLTALFAGMSRPDLFERVIAQSGSFWWPGGEDVATSEWLTAQVNRGATPPARVYLEVGLQEWVLLEPTRRLAAALGGTSTELTYREFDGGHDPACWRGGLADGLIAVLGRSRSVPGA